MSKRAPTRSARIAIIVKSAKNWKNRRLDVNMSKTAPTMSGISAKTARITIFEKNGKNR